MRTLNECVIKVPNGTFRFPQPPLSVTYIRVCNKVGEEVTRLDVGEGDVSLLTEWLNWLYVGLPPLPEKRSPHVGLYQ